MEKACLYERGKALYYKDIFIINFFVMNHLISRTGMLAAAFALIFSAGATSSVHASTVVYSFVARGIVTDFDNSAGTAKIDITKVQNKGKQDLLDNNTEFIVKNAKTVYKVVNGKDKRVTYHNLAIGQEVGIKGVKMNDDTYVVSFIRIEDRTFTAVGNLEEYNDDNHTMTLLMVRSTYKPQAYNKSRNVRVDMVFGDDYSTFYTGNGKTAISFDDVKADAQKVKVMGYITDKNTWKVTKLWNEYKGK